MPLPITWRLDAMVADGPRPLLSSKSMSRASQRLVVEATPRVSVRSVSPLSRCSTATRPTRPGATSSMSTPAKCDARRSIPHCSRLTGLRKALREVLFESPEEVSTTVALVPTAAGDRGVPSWSFRSGGYSANPPVWFGDDVLILAGTSDSYGTVSRVDGRAGRVRWTRALPESAHSPGQTQLVGGTYPPRGWSARRRERSSSLGRSERFFP
jgi:hypothetical protein